MSQYSKFKKGTPSDVALKGTKTMESPCIVWIRSTAPSGRPTMKVNGVTKQAYRVLWEEEKGEIPEGLTVEHICLNKRCMNLEHLEIITETENGRRAREMDMGYRRKSNNEVVREVCALLVNAGIATESQIREVLNTMLPRPMKDNRTKEELERSEVTL